MADPAGAKLEEGTSKLSLEDKPGSGNSGGSGKDKGTPSDQGSASKPKRVRTGCLTCRERHLKCDEGMPVCLNCTKSNRECKRGVRLNFIDTKVEETQMVPQTSDWNISFQDESRDIASEYKGGSERYTVLGEDAMDVQGSEPQAAARVSAPEQQHQQQHQQQQQQQQQQQHQQQHPPPPPSMSHQTLPPIQSPQMPNGGSYSSTSHSHDSRRDSSGSASVSSYSSYQSYHPYPPEPPRQVQPNEPPPSEIRDCLTDPEEVLFMQVFVEEVGLWMDSMDPYKHFSRILPFYALAEPMLLNSILACGARHLCLVNPAFQEDRAIHYYDTATQALLKTLQNPNRDTIICATAAVILNVYEVMTERALQRMNHIAGARALIKECGWNAQSVGIGAACFWLNVGMEVWSCLHFNWQVAWNPDDWGIDMRIDKDTRAGAEESWTHKILYVSAKTANFRASIPRFQESNPTAQAMRLQKRTKEWENLKSLCDAWNECIPRTMHPAAYLLPSQGQGKSLFPEIWLVKRTSIMARLFYHTSMCLLSQMHPNRPEEEDPEMKEMTRYHSRMICGIVAHNKDRGVASASIRCISIGAACLTDFKEQEEILSILKKIKKETGWRIDFLEPELKKKWGWTEEYVRHQQHIHNVMAGNAPLDYPGYNQQHGQQAPQPSPPPAPPLSAASTSGAPSPAMPQIPRGVVNPTMRMADFNAPTHAYQNYWVAPNPGHSDAHYLYRLTDNHYHG